LHSAAAERAFRCSMARGSLFRSCKNWC
jgi:hypothetical protein